MKRFLLVPVALFFVACGKPPPPEPPPAPPQEEAVPEPKKEEPKPEPPKAPEALKKPASQYQIGGKSLSTASCPEIGELIKKAGWIAKDATPSCGGATVGVYEAQQIAIEKGKVKGRFSLVRPAAKPTVAGTSTMVPPGEQAASLKDSKTSFAMADAEADVAVVVELQDPGKTAEAKKLVEGLVKKGK